MMQTLFECFFGKNIRQETGRYLRELADAQAVASRKKAEELLRKLNASNGPNIVVGTTPWGQQVAVPLAEIVKAFAIIGGATGSGKSSVGLLLIEAILRALIEQNGIKYGIGVLDAKGDLFRGVLFLITELERTNPRAAEQLRKRIAMLDFGLPDPVTSYNFSACWPGTDPDVFAAKRADLIMDLLPGPDKLSLGASGVLKKIILLHSASNEPITKIADVVEDEQFRTKLVARCRNPLLTAYFTRQFPHVPKATLGAILRRTDALFACEGVRLALGGDSAPDFRRLQDDGKIVLINCCGKGIPRSVRRFLQALVYLDLTSAIFDRQCPDVDFLWLCDEAQTFFATEQLREATSEVACTARTWHTHFIWFTQNFSTAVQDPRILKILHTNVGWSLSLRGDPADNAFLKAALPVTGRRLRPQEHPFTERSFYSEAEERAIVFEEIACLPKRSAYFWLKNRAAAALRIETAHISIPEGKQLERAICAIRSDPSVGMRLSRKEYDRLVEKRDAEWAEGPGDLGARLKQAYQETRGQAQM